MADSHDHQAQDEPFDCAEVLRQLHVFLDGELTDERRVTISTHLGDCNPCLEVFDFEAELRMVVRQRCAEEVPPALRRRVEEQLWRLLEEREST